MKKKWMVSTALLCSAALLVSGCGGKKTEGFDAAAYTTAYLDGMIKGNVDSLASLSGTSAEDLTAAFDTGIDELVRQMEKLGAKKARMVAKIAGGATMFTFQGKNDMMQVGDRNVEAVKKKLKEISIPILAQDTGKNYGRTVTFYPETGEFHIRAVGKSESII